MKIIKKVDDLGRISIPRDIRRSMGIMGGDSVSIEYNNDKIIIEKSNVDVENRAVDLKTQFHNWLQEREADVSTDSIDQAFDILILEYRKIMEKIK